MGEYISQVVSAPTHTNCTVKLICAGSKHSRITSTFRITQPKGAGGVGEPIRAVDKKPAGRPVPFYSAAARVGAESARAVRMVTNSSPAVG